MMAVVDAR